jgi:hypothetical protein
LGRYRERRVPFSCFALPDQFSAVPRAPVPLYIFCSPGAVFDANEEVGSRFHILRSRSRFRRYRGRRVPFSRFALPKSFSAVPRVHGPAFKFCAPGPVFGDTECSDSHFHVSHSRTRFRRYQGRQFPFSCFALPDPILGGTEGAGSRFHILRSWTRFQQYQGRRIPFSCFQLPDPFSAVPRAPIQFSCLRSWTRFRWYQGRSVPFSYFALSDVYWTTPRAPDLVLMFFAPGPIFCGTEGTGSRFHVLRSRNHVRRYGGRRVLFSCFALLDLFWAAPRVLGPVIMFYAPGPVFSGIETVGSSFHILSTRTHFRRTEGAGSRFCFLRSGTRFRRYRGRRVPFSCFALPNSFLTLLSASGPVFLFYAPGPVLGGMEGVGSRFHVLLS